jgi:hypothetical protein
VFMFAYFAAVLMTPLLLAAGMSEVVLGIYATFKRQNRTVGFSARPHFVAALSIFACFGAYFVLSGFTK